MREERPQVVLEGKRDGDTMSGEWYYVTNEAERQKFSYEKKNGRWEGYFELRLGSKQQKVKEWFILLLEEEEEEEEFEDEEKKNEGKKKKENQVSGNGKNAFGAFGLVGRLEPEVYLERSYTARPPRKKTVKLPVGHVSRTKSVRAAALKRKVSSDQVETESESEESVFLETELFKQKKTHKKESHKKKKKSQHHHTLRDKDDTEGRRLTYTLERTFAEDETGSYRWLWASVESDEVYEGTINEHGLRHGVGTCVYLKHALVYRGEWRLGREHGKGSLFDAETRHLLYLGDFIEGKMHGHGRCFLNNGDTYIGDLRENSRHGKGRYMTKAGDEYCGDWRDNSRHGRGELTKVNGTKYFGEWQRDARQGKGELIVDDGTHYTGTFVANELEGKGECRYPDGQMYQGIFKEGYRQGRGNLLWPCGASYEGRFRFDVIDGSGGALSFPPRPLPLERHTRPPKIINPPQSSSNSSQESHDEVIPLPAGWLIPVELKNDIARIHQRAGFDHLGL